MRIRSTLTVAALALLAAVPAAGAHAQAIVVCKLIPSSSVTKIPGVTPKCKESQPLKGGGSNTYSGTWSGATPKAPDVTVTIAVFNDSTWLALARKNLKQGLPSANPAKLAGVGTAAFISNGPTTTAVHVLRGKSTAYIIVTSASSKGWSKTQVVTLAKAVAAKLS
jgi:hypothetical protein